MCHLRRKHRVALVASFLAGNNPEQLFEPPESTSATALRVGGYTIVAAKEIASLLPLGRYKVWTCHSIVGWSIAVRMLGSS